MVRTEMKQQLADKLVELRELFEQATCDGEPIDLCDSDGLGFPDIGTAINTLEDMIAYYVD